MMFSSAFMNSAAVRARSNNLKLFRNVLPSDTSTISSVE